MNARRTFAGTRGLLLPGVFFLFLSFLVSGYRVYDGNQSIQIPLVRVLSGTATFPGDPFVETLDGYVSLLWPGVALLTRIFSVESVLAVGQILSRGLGIYAAYRLAAALVPGNRLASLGAMAALAMAPQPVVGGGTVVTSYFEQTGLAMALALLALALSLERRWIAVALLTALVTNVNILYGLYLVSYLTGAWLIDRDRASAWRERLPPAALCAVLVLPVVVLTARHVGAGAEDPERWLEIARARFPGHLAPELWRPRHLVKMLLLVAATVIVVREAPVADRVRRYAFAWSAMALAWLVAAPAFEQLGVAAGVRLQPARGADVWVGFAAVALPALLAIRAADDASRTRRVAFLALLASILFWRPAMPPALLLLALVVLGAGRWRVLDRSAAMPVTVLALTALVAIAFTAVRVRQYDALVVETDRPPGSAPVVGWARGTPPETTFLVSPAWHDFRARTGRPVFVTWKDGSAMLWRAAYASVWSERMRAIGVTLTDGAVGGELEAEAEQAFRMLRPEEAQALAARYGVDYWVAPIATETSLPTVFESDMYRVVDVRASVEGARGTSRPGGREASNG